MDFKESNFYKYYTEKGNLTDDEFDQLKEFYSFKSVEHNNFLLRAGELSRYAFFVESGLLQSFALDEKGGEHIIQFAPENWIISDRSSQYFDEPSDYYIKAIEPSVIVFLNPEFIEKASSMNATFTCFVESSLQRNVHVQQKRITSLLAMTAKERYLSFIEMYPSLLLRVPQWMIASYLGITPESLSRVRRELITNDQKQRDQNNS